jgi:hypothetical protein
VALADNASPPGRPYGAKSRRVIEAVSSGFNTLHRIAEFTQIDYRTVNSLVFSLEQQGRLIGKRVGKSSCPLAHHQPAAADG